jgi:hypothetical protein
MSTKNTDKTWNQRFIPFVQSKGTLGKSFFAALLLEWLQYGKVDFKAIDSDVSHLGLASRYPERTNLFNASKDADEFGKLVGGLPNAPVVIFDCRANFTDDFLDYSAHYRLLEVFEKKGFRATIPIFVSDDGDAMKSAGNLYEYFEADADFVMIDNPKIFKSDDFRRTGLYKALVNRGAPMILIPEIHTFSKNWWMAAEDRAGRNLSITAVIDEKNCESSVHFELSGIKDLVFRQLEDNAELFLPEIGLLKEKVTRVNHDKPAQRSTRFKNPLLSKS